MQNELSLNGYGKKEMYTKKKTNLNEKKNKS